MAIQVYVTSEGDAENERHDTAMARGMSEQYQIEFPSEFVFTQSTARADTVCADAGLNVDFAGLLSAAKTIGRWPPFVAKPINAGGDYWLRDGNDHRHLIIRAWAKEFLPSLIDAAALPRRRPAYGWW